MSYRSLNPCDRKAQNDISPLGRSTSYGKINLIAEVRQRRNGSSAVFDALFIPLTNFLIVQTLPGLAHGRREIHEWALNSGTTSGVLHVKVNVGVCSLRRQIANMLASGDPIFEFYQNVV